jgi:hypothetical protein
MFEKENTERHYLPHSEISKSESCDLKAKICFQKTNGKA